MVWALTLNPSSVEIYSSACWTIESAIDPENLRQLELTKLGFLATIDLYNLAFTE